MSLGESSVIASWVAAIVAIGSLIVIAKKLTHIQRGQYSDGISKVYDTFIELDRFFLEHPDFRPFVYDGKSPDEVSPELYEALAEMVTDMFYKAYNQEKVLDPHGFKAEISYMKDVFKSPLMSNYLKSHKKWYRKDFVSDMLNENPGKPNKVNDA